MVVGVHVMHLAIKQNAATWLLLATAGRLPFPFLCCMTISVSLSEKEHKTGGRGTRGGMGKESGRRLQGPRAGGGGGGGTCGIRCWRGRTVLLPRIAAARQPFTFSYSVKLPAWNTKSGDVEILCEWQLSLARRLA